MDGGALDFIATDRDPELEAMETCFDLLERLEPFAQDRVLKYLAVRLSGGSENASAKDLVFAQIMREPGLRGNELVERLGLLNERTVRTCLHRLKYAEQIHQRDGKWHPSTTQAANSPAQAPPASPAPGSTTLLLNED